MTPRNEMMQYIYNKTLFKFFKIHKTLTNKFE